MTKIDALRRILLPCFSPAAAKPTNRSSTAAAAATSTKKRLSTSLRDDLDDISSATSAAKNPQDQDSQSSSPTAGDDGSDSPTPPPPRPSKSMVIGTIFGHRRGHVWFCVQHDRLATRPALLLELSISTHQLVNEMRFGLVRVTLECDDSTRSQLAACPLRSVPVWSVHCNGRKLGFAARRKANEKVKSMLKTMQSMTVGAGVMPAGFGFGSGSEADSGQEVMYMRANYEHVVGSADSESFHLINPDQGPGQELSVFLLRSRHS